MQHLDEGTIHSWLDGALGVDESARVEAHVKECPECAAAVAEARGFVAGSSRILTALDNAPRGVIPAAAPKKRFDPFVWRVAATVLVVAAGSLVVFRNSGRETQMATIATDTASMLETVAPGSPGDAIIGTTPQPAPSIARQANPSRGISSSNSQPSVASGEQSAAKTKVSSAPSIELSKKIDADQRADNDPPERRALAGRAAGSFGQQNAAASAYAGAAAPTAPVAAPSVEAGGFAMDMAREPQRLKVVGTPRRVGMKVTLYEVVPGDTVTLTEPMLASLSSIETTGANVAAKARTERAMAPQSVARPEAAAAAAPDSQRGAVLRSVPTSTPTPALPAPVRQVEVANGVTTISWRDVTTGNELKLSGRMSEARLQQVRIRIERERAAAAKKIP